METITKNCRCGICVKKITIMLLLASGFTGWAQDSLALKRLEDSTRRYDSLAKPYFDSIRRGPFKTQNGFSLSPISFRVERVNGVVLGIGHYPNEIIPMQRVNGINLEINGNGALAIVGIPFGLYGLAQIEEMDTDQPMPATSLKVKGINISTGGFFEGAEMTGLNISTFTIMNKMSGFSVSPGFLIGYNVNGVSLCGIVSSAQTLNGMSLGFVNTNLDTNGAQFGAMNFSETLKGMQIGLVNVVSHESKGIQIGLVNHSKSRCFQIGLLNINKKRALPIINW